MTPDNNKVHFLTNATSLPIPQRMDSFNKLNAKYGLPLCQNNVNAF
jgi:hypothetical protein